MSFNGTRMLPADDLCCLLRRMREAIRKQEAEQKPGSLTPEEVKTIKRLWQEYYPEVPWESRGTVMVAYGDNGHSAVYTEIPVPNATVTIFTKLLGPDCIWS